MPPEIGVALYLLSPSCYSNKGDILTITLMAVMITMEVIRRSTVVYLLSGAFGTTNSRCFVFIRISNDTRQWLWFDYLDLCPSSWLGSWPSFLTSSSFAPSRKKC